MTENKVLSLTSPPEKLDRNCPKQRVSPFRKTTIDGLALDVCGLKSNIKHYISTVAKAVITSTYTPPKVNVARRIVPRIARRRV